MDKGQKRILIMALFAGELMMKSGAEIYRVEDTITRICHAYGINYVECFATTTGIFLSLDNGGETENMSTFIKRIHGSSTDIGKISRLNEFSRQFTNAGLSVDEGFERLKVIGKIKPYPVYARLIAAVMIGAPLCLNFGGTPTDAMLCAVITPVAYLASLGIGKLRLNSFISTFLSCACCGILSAAVAGLGISSTLSPLIIASVTIYMPGVAITNAARDLLSGDMLSGLARAAEALICAIAIAGGVGVMLKFWTATVGPIPPEILVKYALPMAFFFGFFPTFAFCILFNVPKKHMAAASIIGGAGFWLYIYCTGIGYSVILAGVLSAGLVAFLGEIASRAGKDATTLFIIPGIIPLVPGTGMYKTMSFILDNDFNNAIATGSETLLFAGGLAVAIGVIASFAKIFTAAVREIKGRSKN
jgi:uncharacterized membrane protein YjjP (DUF1212 family)